MNKHLILAACVAASCVATDLVAQTVVFPKDHAKQEGSSATSIPFFAGPCRAQTCVSEAKGRPIRMSSLSFRRAAWRTPGSSGPLPISVEIKVGDADFTKLSSTFDSNWIGSPTTVMKRKIINTPNWSKASRAFPAPFDLRMVFDKTFVFSGKNDLMIETVQDGARLPFTHTWLNGVFYRENDEVCGGTRMTSPGCSGPNRDITASFFFCSLFSGKFSDARVGIRNAPGNAPAAFLIGTKNPNLKIPGACAVLASSADLTFALGLTDSRGTAGLRLITGPYDGSAAGTRIYTQALALDPTQTGLPIALSHGNETIMPNKTSPIAIREIYVTNSTTAKEGTGPRDGGVVFAVN